MYYVKHDPYKSDIYSMGIMLLVMYFLKQGKQLKEVKAMLNDDNNNRDYEKTY